MIQIVIHKHGMRKPTKTSANHVLVLFFKLSEHQFPYQQNKDSITHISDKDSKYRPVEIALLIKMLAMQA